jgi:hypothetical protein
MRDTDQASAAGCDGRVACGAGGAMEVFEIVVVLSPGGKASAAMARATTRRTPYSSAS